MSISRDELLAQMEAADFAETGQRRPRGTSAMLDVVLAAGERRWRCGYYQELEVIDGFYREWGSHEGSTCHSGHELNDGERRDRGCGWVTVLPVWEEGK